MKFPNQSGGAPREVQMSARYLAAIIVPRTAMDRRASELADAVSAANIADTPIGPIVAKKCCES